ncbi:HIG1 domain family member 2A, mitochondrial [Schistocerca piceifrons]|uniref:HIG1 domain family member 2A, mitochondrial n=1 Tax=Schistocerca piceifrons TaxID=274613 RepID=UPI001F5E760A|nr:HIG1 domain family member 2A, mitochondrial [Schistocerca piceifrons]XP_049776863.1 HIG1 domain family member 2A, mitochondrial [Schistocerca cancellata]XP_049857877.1 HIG1 domain family member 2A, mitochondrial [Schistocerca gregaria]XP_049952964.1 HIG1 domain family member 2A, mitochondrial [Schistocerca serialis cubense]
MQNSKSESREEPEPTFDWLQLQKDVRATNTQETTREKFARKVSENPLVPIGCLATFCALSYGLWSFRTGQRRMSQYMMRLRIAAQGITIAALIVGLGISATRKSN